MSSKLSKGLAIGGLLVALAALVAGAAAVALGFRGFGARRTGVLFVSDCTGVNGHSPSGEPITSCVGTPHVQLTVDGHDDGDDFAGARLLSSGTRVVFKVSASSDDARAVSCKIVLVGSQRTLVQRSGGESATCAATIP